MGIQPGSPRQARKWTKQRYQVWPSQGQIWAASKPKAGPLSVTGNQEPGKRPQAWEGRDQRSWCSESYGMRASCLLTLHCPWAVNPWITTFGRFEGWGTENGHAGRGERQWETEVGSWLKKSPTPWRLEVSYCPHRPSTQKGNGIFLSLVGAEHGQCPPMGVTLSR